MYTDNVSRMTGLGSGMDIDGMVTKLMNAESQKLYKVQQKRQLQAWKQQAYRSQISNINTFKDQYFGSNKATNLRYEAAFGNFKTSITSGGADSKAISVTSSNASADYSVQVGQLASTAKLEGSGSVVKNIEGSLVVGQSMAENMRPSDTMEVTLDGKTTKIKFDGGILDQIQNDSTSTVQEKNQLLIDNINSQLKDAFGTEINGGQKVKMTYDQSANKVGVQTTSGHTVSIADTTARKDVMALDKIEYDTDGKLKDAISGNFNIKIGADTYTVGLDIAQGKTTKETADAINEALKKAKNNTTNAETDIRSSVSAINTDSRDASIFLMGTDETKNVGVSFTPTDPDGQSVMTDNDQTLRKTTLFADFGLKNGQNNQLDTSKTTLGDMFGITGPGSVYVNNQQIDFDEKTSIAAFMTKVNDNVAAGVKMSFNKAKNTFMIESKETGANSKVSLTDSNSLFQNMKLSTNEVKGKDAIFSVDGVWTSRSSNAVDMGGFKFNINETTANEDITDADLQDLVNGSSASASKFDSLHVTSTPDVDTTYNKIKAFVDDYNKMIAGMNTVTSEHREKSGDYTYYEPLTDTQKEAMSETEIEKWEDKAKTGLLYNDSYLRGFSTKMRQDMYSSVDLGDGHKISLYDIGITTTSDLSKPGLMSIDEDKLRKAISDRGDDIVTLFTKADTGVADKLYNNINNAVGAKGSLRNLAGIANTTSDTDNILSKSLKDYDSQIDTLKDYLYNKEMSYYDMFSRMDQAMSSSNSQMSLVQAFQG